MNLSLPPDFHVNVIADSLGIKTSAGREFLQIALENALLMDRKQQDYGSKNISSFGVFGVVVRMNDKFERIKNLFNNRRKRAVNESIRDSFRDVSNYAIIALILEMGKWPEK
jgi:hypothetical protein